MVNRFKIASLIHFNTINILIINTIVIENVGTHLEALDLVHSKPGLLVDLCKI